MHFTHPHPQMRNETAVVGCQPPPLRFARCAVLRSGPQRLGHADQILVAHRNGAAAVIARAAISCLREAEP
jgi:hypothetical protein